MSPDKVSKIIEKHTGNGDGVIAILEDIQTKYGYLTEEALRTVANQTGRPLVDIFGVATFYRYFRLKPVGKHIITVCIGTTCHVRGAPGVVEEFQRQLGISAGETTSDKEFTLETVNCLGACAIGPVVLVDGHYFANVDTAKSKQILKKVQSGLKKTDIKTDERVFPLKVNCPRCNHSLMDTQDFIDDQPAIRLTVSFGQEHGWLRMSSLYGSYNIDSENKIPMDTMINCFCPHCHGELVGASNCVECGAPMVPMIVHEGGVIQICSRRGCKGHMLDLNGVNL